MQLVFSDEFNTDGRTFYPGDDPYWEAENLHYWVRFECSPLSRIFMKIFSLGYQQLGVVRSRSNYNRGRSLVITFSEKQTHGLDYEGGTRI